MRKILLVYYEPIPSGQTTHVLSLARGLDPTRYDVTVALPDVLPTCADDFRQAGAKVVPLSMSRVRWKFQAIQTLARMVRREQYDIVHIHSQEAGVVARVVCWLAGARRIFYTPQTIDIRRKLLQPLYQVAEVLLSNLTTCILSVNQADRERLISWGINSRKVVTLPNGLDLQYFRSTQAAVALRRSMNIPEEGPLVMQVGRLAQQKDPAAFVRGAQQVLRVHPGAYFVMVGEGPLQAEINTLICQERLSDRIRLLGRQPDAYQLIDAADVVTLTSLWEGTPYSIMEAMAWRKPVVVTAVNGCRELVVDGQTGFVVESGDSAAWAGRVSLLLDDEALRAQMGESGYQRVREYYSVDHMIATLEKLYQGE